MAETKIEWAEKVWNPTVGCSRVSEGCMNCYAERMARRLAAMGHPEYQGLLTEDGRWNGKVRILPGKLAQLQHWRKPRRIFVDSMSDLFHPDVPDEFIWKVFDTMTSGNRRHTYIILTKRPQRMRDWFLANQERFWHYPAPGKDMQYITAPWPDPCIWLGVSVENQAAADERIPLLLQTPAAVRFVSCEPLLGPVDLTHVHDKINRVYYDAVGGHRFDYDSDGYGVAAPAREKLDWVIVGGETGPGAWPMYPDWARSIRDQCVAAGVPFFFKQWGEWTSAFPQERSLAHIQEAYRNGRSYWRVGKKAAGRILDGRTWDQYPETG
jgi:protein gp37